MSSPTVRVEKATSDLLVTPDWTMNMDICDTVNTDHWHAKDVIKATKKRLQHKNPKVQFLALTLLETMIKNCGDYVHLQVVERDILQEMVKIVRKKTDMQVREKILVLLDSWQEAFGGPGGRYPHYYRAYAELKQSGVQFPQRSADSSLIFTPTHPALTLGHPQAGMASNSSIRLDEATPSEMANLSLSALDSIQSVMELLSDMLKAVDPSDRGAVKDDIITELVTQCRSNQKKLMQMINSTGAEELLEQGLALNDSLQSLLAKHDAIASGSPLPDKTTETLPTPSIVIVSSPLVTHPFDVEEEDEDDEFAQLARRNSKLKPETKSSPTESNLHPAPPHLSDATTAIVAAHCTEASPSLLSEELALPDPPALVKTVSEESEMINLLSITLSANPSPPRTPLVTPPPAPNPTGPPEVLSSKEQGYPYKPDQPYPSNQPYSSNGSYATPWAQPQPHSQPQPQPQPQVPQFSSSYPPPPWETPSSANPNPFIPATYQFSVPSTPAAPVSSANHSVAHGAPPVPTQIPGPMQQRGSFGFRVTSAGPRQLAPPAASKPFVPSYRLFEDLMDSRNSDRSRKTSSTSPNLSGQGMIGGRK